MDPNYHLYLAYSENQYDPINDSYYPISPELLEAIKNDQRVSNSLVFDMNRQTIYAKGKEFGGLNAVFEKVNEGKYDMANPANLIMTEAYFITAVSQDQYGRISYSYSSAYFPFDFSEGILDNEHGGAYVTGLQITENGVITHRYADVNHTTKRGKLSASIYNVNNHTINTIVVDDPKNIVLGSDMAVIEEAEGITNVYDVTTSELLWDNLYYDEPHKNMTVNYYGDIIAWDTTGPVTYIFSDDFDNEYRFESSLETPITNVFVKDDVVAIYYSDNNIYFYRRDDEEEKYDLLGNKTIRGNGFILTTNAFYFKDSRGTAISRYTLGLPTDQYPVSRNTTAVISSAQLPIAVKNGNKHSDYSVSQTNNFAYVTTSRIPSLITYTFGRVGSANYLGIFSFGSINKITWDCSKIAVLNAGNKLFIINSSILKPIGGLIGREDIGDIPSLEKGGDDRLIGQAEYITMTNVADAIVNNDSLFCVLDTNGNVSLYGFDDESEDGYYVQQPNVLQNVSKLVSFEYDENNASSNIKAIHSVNTGIIDYVYLDKQGNLMYHQHDASMDSGEWLSNETITNSHATNVVVGIEQDANGQVTYTFSSINTTHHTIPYLELILSDINPPNWNVPITYIHLDEDGNLSYNITDLETNSGTYLNVTYNNGGKLTNAINPSTYTLVLSGISQNHVGKISYTYSAIYTDPRDYKYHRINLQQITPKNNTDDWGYALIGIKSTNNDSNTELHTISYQVKAFVTKNYVDNIVTDSFRTNDALRYCGTVSPSNAENGELTFSHIYNSGPIHGNDDDFDRGAVYKVSAVGFIGTQRVSPGDMIICNTDNIGNSPRTNFAAWDVINENIDLRTLDPTELAIENKVLTYVHLTNDGTLSYSFDKFQFSYGINWDVIQRPDRATNDEINILSPRYHEFSRTVTRVINDVKIRQEGLNVNLDISYAYIWAERNHHDTIQDGPRMNQVITNVHLDESGLLSFNATDLSYASLSPSETIPSSYYYQDVITDIAQLGYGAIQPVKKRLRISDEQSRFIQTTDLVYISGPKTKINGNVGQVSYSYYSGTSYVKNGNLYTTRIISPTILGENATINSIVNTSTLNADNVNTTNATIIDETVVDLNVVGNTTLGSEPTNSLTINATNTTLPGDATIDFTNLKSLWGVVLGTETSRLLTRNMLMLYDQDSGEIIYSNAIGRHQTPLAICVIPSDLMPDGIARFMSLNYIKPANNSKPALPTWGIRGIDTLLVNKTKINTEISKKYSAFIATDYLSGFASDIRGLGWYSKHDDNILLYSGRFANNLNSVLFDYIDSESILGDFNGKQNTALLNSSDYQAAFACTNYQIGNNTPDLDWYLPSITELSLAMTWASSINTALHSISNGVTEIDLNSRIWSSTEYDSKTAFVLDTSTGQINICHKDYKTFVRAFCKVYP